ncbi:hypothetical protein JHK85_000129 [Glycine max]|nr:hypothetical protein JHK85_000129 [Glycine max]
MKLGIRLVSDVCLLEIEAEFDCLQLIQALKFVVIKHSILTLKEEDCSSRAYALDVLAKLYSHRVWIKEVPPEICSLDLAPERAFADFVLCNLAWAPAREKARVG